MTTVAGNRYEVQTVTIAQSATVSTDVALRSSDLFGIWAPVLTNCSVYAQASWDTTSANFVRVHNPAGSGTWTWAAGTGSAAISGQDALFPFPYLRLETTVAQAAARHFIVVTKL
jgi:hypothetical protein